MRCERNTTQAVWFHGVEGKEGGVAAEDVSRLEGRGGARGFADFVLCAWVKVARALQYSLLFVLCSLVVTRMTNATSLGLVFEDR